MIRKVALQIAVPALLVLVAFNGYLAIRHLRRIRLSGAQTLESSAIQANIAAVRQDLADMESGQRGYLLTEDNDYLKPYLEAKERIGSTFAQLRSGLMLPERGGRAEQERALESQLESVAGSKQAEMERTIDLRQKGYRHRAFVMVASNEGRDYMEQARGLLASLSAMERNSFSDFARERDADLSKAFSQTIAANLCLLILTACLFGVIRYHGRALERDAALSRQGLAARDLQLKKITSVLSEQTRTRIAVIQQNARLLLEKFGGFLPRQGCEYAEEIKESAAQLEHLRKELIDEPLPEIKRKAA